MFSFQLPITILAAIVARIYAEDSLLCNADFSSANATSSVASMNFNSAEISIHSWAVTVAPSSSASNDEAETSIWYDPGVADYTNNSAIGYDLCAFFISDLPENANGLAQSSGGCGAIPQSCQDALRSRASAEASSRTTDVEDISGDIQDICNAIGGSFGDRTHIWPSECREAFGEEGYRDGEYVSAKVTSMAITGYNTSGLAPDCKVKGAGKNFDRVDFVPDEDMSYDDATRNTWPILSVYMPVALPKRRKSIGNVYTSLNCLRPDSFSEGSRVSPELAQGTPSASVAVRVLGSAGVATGALTVILSATALLSEVL